MASMVGQPLVWASVTAFAFVVNTACRTCRWQGKVGEIS
jgi:hypothetical protein